MLEAIFNLIIRFIKLAIGIKGALRAIISLMQDEFKTFYNSEILH